MRDYQEVVDILQTVVATPGGWDEAELARLATEYAEQCQAANKRISQCFQLLRQGQVAEAIRMAEMEPRLIDWVGVLDFGERERWESLCELLGLPLPPPLQRDRIKAINEAYMMSPTVESLLRLWRYQNLVRAPIDERLDTLRRLAKADETNLSWQEDLREFEEVFLKEIGQHVRAAAKAGDLERLYQLRNQLQLANWTVATPGQVTRELNEAIQSLERMQLKKELSDLVEQIDGAYAARDGETLGEALQRFDSVCTSLNLNGDDPRVLRVEPAREWWTQWRNEEIQRQRAAAAQAALERELDRRCTLEQITKMYDTATAGGRTLPIELERRYRLVVERLEKEQRQRHQLRLMLVGAAAVVMLVGVIVAVWFIIQDRERARIVHDVDQFAAEGNFAAADDFLKRLKEERPGMFHSPAIQAAVARLQQARDKEAQRRKDFEDLASKIQNDINGGRPSQSDINRLKELARDEQEKLVAQGLANRAAERWQELERQARDSWKERKMALEEKLNRLEEADISLVTLAEIDGLEKSIRELMHDTAVPESLTESAAPLLARVRELKSRREQYQRNLQRLQALVGAIGQRGMFEAALRQLGKEAKNPFAEDCNKVADSLPWAVVDEWNSFAQRWNSTRENPVPSVATELLATLQEKGYPAVKSGGWKDFVESEWEPYLESLSGRDGNAMNGILACWDTPIVARSYRYRVIDNNKTSIYYSFEDMRGSLVSRGGAVIGVPVLIGNDPFQISALESDDSPTNGQIEKKGLPTSDIIIDISPQTRLRESVDTLLKDIQSSPGNMERLACELLVSMIRFQEEAKERWTSTGGSFNTGQPTDSSLAVPVNDYIFAKLFLDTVTSVSSLSPLFAKHWAPTVKELEENLPRCARNWRDYEAESDVKPEIALRVPSLKEAESLAAATARDLTQVRQPLPTLQWVGFVFFVEEDNLTPRYYGLPDSFRPHTVLVGVPITSFGKVSFQSFRVVAVIDEKQALNWQDTLPFGSPVFAFVGVSAEPRE